MSSTREYSGFSSCSLVPTLFPLSNVSNKIFRNLHFSHIVVLALAFSACSERPSEPEVVDESCEELGTCETAFYGPIEVTSTKTDGKVVSHAKIAGEEVLAVEWMARGDSVDLILTPPESPPLEAMAFDGGLPTLANANNVAAVILGLNNSELLNETHGGSKTSLSLDFLSAVDPGNNHSGCDVINNWRVGSCSLWGYCCDEHDVCINKHCKSPYGDIRVCLVKDPVKCLLLSPLCYLCHYEVIDCYLEVEREKVGAPAHCCLEGNCDKPQQCIIPGDPAIPTEPGYAEPDACKCAKNRICPDCAKNDECTLADLCTGVPDPCQDDHDPPRCSWCGDVHVRTPDGLAYDFQGAGEYLLVASADGDVVVQVRMEPWGSSRLVSVNTAVAMNVNGDRVGVYVGRSPALYVNGQPTEMAAGTVDLVNGGHIHKFDHPSRTEYLVVWPSGFLTSAKLSRRSYLDVGVSRPSGLQATFEGLGGNLNGQATDDLLTRNGITLGSPILFDDLYRSFGDSWRVSAAESLFDYEPGTSTETFQLNDFPLRRVTTADFDQTAVDAARQICEAAGIEDPILLEDCILDLVATGEHDFVESALDSELPTVTLEVVEVVNGGFDLNAEGWFWENIDFQGGWRSTGGNPGGNFAINQAGQLATDPKLCQVIEGLAVGQSYRITGDYASFAPQFGDPAKPDAFAVTLDGAVLLELPRPSPVSTDWAAFSTDPITGTEDPTVCFVAERHGDDSSFRVDNIALKGTQHTRLAH